VWIWWLVPFARQHPIPQRDNRQVVLAQRKVTARPPYIFARFSTCWLLFVPKSEIPLEGVSLWLDFGHPESRDNYIKDHCKGRLLQRHPEAVWPCKFVCTVRRDVCRKLNNKSVISFMQILFIMPVLKLSRYTVYITQPPTYVWHKFNFSEFLSLHTERTTQTHYSDNTSLEILNVKLYLIYEKNILMLFN